MLDLRTPGIKIAQKPYKIGSLGPKALKYESLDGKREWHEDAKDDNGSLREGKFRVAGRIDQP